MTTDDLRLVPANQFSIEELTAIYNQTRVDYLVPMPMNAARLAEYIAVYDVNLENSLVATTQEGEMLGVAMLGVRNGRAWITRLGVLPNTRRGGVGKGLMTGLVENASRLKLNFVMLEVIKNNEPAHRLFLRTGFQEIGELLVLRRSPRMPPPDPVIADVEKLERFDAIRLIERNRRMLPWTNQSESFTNAQEISGMHLTLSDGSQGWLAYQRQKFTLTRFVFETETGNPVEMAYAFLSHLHNQYPRLDTQIENVRVNDPHLPAFYEMGYMESFRRVEMWLGDLPANLKGLRL